jgi:hypothetical protein
MRSTFKVLFYLKRDKQKTNGLVLLFCRITVDGKEVRFGMKCDVNPKYWDVETGKATGRTAKAAKTNALVDSAKADATIMLPPRKSGMFFRASRLNSKPYWNCLTAITASENYRLASTSTNPRLTGTVPSAEQFPVLSCTNTTCTIFQ